MLVPTLTKIAARIANRRELLIPVLVLPHPWEESRQQSLNVVTSRTSKVDLILVEEKSRIKVFKRRYGLSDLIILI